MGPDAVAHCDGLVPDMVVDGVPGSLGGVTIHRRLGADSGAPARGGTLMVVVMAAGALLAECCCSTAGV